ncbi:MAG: VOC family protein [Cellvibrionaceae bacterium]|nr:VOC family protein [Cellvibrionaceae bacterium]
MKKVLLLISLCFSQIIWAAESPFLGIGIAVNDIPEKLPHYQTILGIKQWQYIDLNVEGGAIRLARGEFKGKSVDLMQPLHGKTNLADFIQQRGEGIFHLLVDQNYLEDKAAYKLAALEKASSDISHIPNAKPYQQQWLDSYDALGVNLSFAAAPPTKQHYWGVADLDSLQKDAPLNTASIAQIGIVIESAEKTALQWKELLGLSPWVFVDFKPPMTSNGQYLGAAGSGYSEVHVGYGQWFDLQIELLQPVAGPTPHRDYLRRYGDGAHHFSLGRLLEHDQLLQYLQANDVALQMQSDNGGLNRTASYMGSEKQLGWVLEFTKAFKGLGSLKIVKQIP